MIPTRALPDRSGRMDNRNPAKRADIYENIRIKTSSKFTRKAPSSLPTHFDPPPNNLDAPTFSVNPQEHITALEIFSKIPRFWINSLVKINNTNGQNINPDRHIRRNMGG